MTARVYFAYDDADGRRVAAVRWNDMVERRRLARALVDVLARA